MSKITSKNNKLTQVFVRRWQRFWMRYAGINKSGKFASWLASWFSPPHYGRESLALIRGNGYISAKATIYHSNLRYHKAFIDDYCLIYQNKNGGPINLGSEVRIYRNTILETGQNGYITIGDHSSIHPRCQLNAYVSGIEIGNNVMIAANCALFSYDHGIDANLPIRKQPLTSKGTIKIGNDAWIGTGAIILSGITIGEGAIVGAGAVVTRDIPNNGIVVGNPAKLVKTRS